MATSTRKRILYLESLALKQAALLRSLQTSYGQAIPPSLAKQIKELTDAAAMIPEAQANRARAEAKKLLKPKGVANAA